MPRRLTRNRRDAVISGVAAGFADYFDVDPVLVRLAFVVLTIAEGFGLLVYVVCWAIMPARDEAVAHVETDTDSVGEPTSPGQPDRSGQPGHWSLGGTVADEIHAAGERVRAAAHRVTGEMREAREAGRGRAIVGVMLIVGGSMLLLDRFAWMFRWPYWLRFDSLWPLVLVAIGVSLLLRSREEQT